MYIKDVPGYEEYFEVSDTGDVFSKERYVLNNGTKVLKPRRKLAPTSNGIGYLQVGLQVNGKRVRKYVHRLVAEAFLGICNSGLEVNHIDADKSNNRLTNLEYITHSQNCKLRSN
jgi:hypothetical protein